MMSWLRKSRFQLISTVCWLRKSRFQLISMVLPAEFKPGVMSVACMSIAQVLQQPAEIHFLLCRVFAYDRLSCVRSADMPELRHHCANTAHNCQTFTQKRLRQQSHVHFAHCADGKGNNPQAGHAMRQLAWRVLTSCTASVPSYRPTASMLGLWTEKSTAVTPEGVEKDHRGYPGFFRDHSATMP